jgi:AcrR family transcriptional regulator
MTARGSAREPVPALTPRAEQTRSAIADAAMALFRERGYDATTMRAVAQRAGVSLGNAYYYFGSKEELIFQFYAHNQAEHEAACRGLLAAETDLGARLRGTIRALLDVLMPYHSFAAAFYKHAAEPTSPLSPFSSKSSEPRRQAIALYREVIEGSSARVSRDLGERLPELFWLYSLGVVLYWVHDTSPGCARTYWLVDATVPVVVRLVAAARVPVLRAALRDVLAVVDGLSGQVADGPEEHPV